TMTLEHPTGALADSRRFDDFEHVLCGNAVARKLQPIRTHLEKGKAEDALNPQIASPGHVADDGADLVGSLLDDGQVVAEDLHDDVGARSREELVHPVLDRL